MKCDFCVAAAVTVTLTLVHAAHCTFSVHSLDMCTYGDICECVKDHVFATRMGRPPLLMKINICLSENKNHSIPFLMELHKWIIVRVCARVFGDKRVDEE